MRWKRMVSVFWLGLAGWLGVGCIYQSLLPYEVLDYRIDRPRVLAVSALSSTPVHGEPTVIDALAVVPLGQRIEGLRVEVCGVQTELRTQHVPFACFAEPELVEPIGDALPAIWDPPDLSAVTCDPATTGGLTYYTQDSGLGGGETADTGTSAPGFIPCTSAVPVLVAIDNGEEEAFGGTYLGIPAGPDRQGGPRVSPLADTHRELSVIGEPVAGSELLLRYEIGVEVNSYAWYVDAGELLRTGRTSAQGSDEDGIAFTLNELRVPEDHRGPLRVFVVVVTGSFVAWDEMTLEVVP